jgi:DNA polymerase-1
MLPVAHPSTIYTFDKQSAELCCQMQVDGFNFDVTKAVMLSAQLRKIETQAVKNMSAAIGRPLKLGKTGGLGGDLRKAFFDDLHAPVYFRSELTNTPSLGVDAMRAYAVCADDRLAALATAVLEHRRARKIRSTYIDRIIVDPDGRVHPTWLNYGTVGGRWSCQGPNLQNIPRAGTDPTKAQGGVRSLYTASRGCWLVTFDFSQLEMRIAAYATGDETMITACESSDLHSHNAQLVFGNVFDPDRYKALSALDTTNSLTGNDYDDFVALKTYRTCAKSSGFAVCYMAKATTVHSRLIADGQRVSLRQVEGMLRQMRRSFRSYYRRQEEWLDGVVKNGFITTPILGRKRWLGHDPSPTEAANFPIQGGAADVVNTKVLELVRRLRAAKLRTRMVAQVHDSVALDTHENDVDKVRSMCYEVCAEPITIASSGTRYEAVFPIDLEITQHWK